MHGSDVLINALVFLAAAVVIVPLLKMLKSSPVLGYLAAGVLIGPYGLGFFANADAPNTLAELGVVFLLFTIGLELSLGRLRQLGRLVFGLGTLQVSVTGVVIGAVALLLGTDINAAIVVGAGLALSSTAFVLQLLSERGERTTPFGQIAFAVLLFQDLVIVPLLILVPLLGAEGATLFTSLATAILKAGAAIVAVIVAGRLVLRPAYRFIAGTGGSELFVAATLLVVLGTSWLLSLAGLSMALGAFLAGLLLAETEYRHQVEADIRPFRGLLLGLFFMTIGLSVNIALVADEIVRVLLLVAALLIGKSVLIALLCWAIRLPFGTSARVGLLLSQGGEFGFLLFGVAMTAGVIPERLGAILLATVTISMAATPLMAWLGDKVSHVLNPPIRRDLTRIEAVSTELTDHVVIIGFGRVGQTIGMILSACGIPHLALDRDQKLIAECRYRETPVFYGDATDIAVLSAAGVGRARAAVVTVDQAQATSLTVAALRESFPDLEIIVRARDLAHVLHLERLGASAVVPDTVEASLQLGGLVLRSTGINAEDISDLLDDFREDDYARLGEVVDDDGAATKSRPASSGS